MALNEVKIRNTYAALKQKAARYLDKGNVHKCLLYSHLAAYTNSSFYLSFHDDELESLLSKVGDRVNKVDETLLKLRPERCVLIDSLARYRGGLTVQYVSAIVAAGWELLYITEQEIDAPQRKELKAFLQTQPNVTILEVPHGLKGVQKLQYMYDAVVAFAPSKVYKHQNSYDAYLTALSYSLPAKMTKFTIDIADHAFVLGYASGHYAFEFRELGCSIANTHRHQPADRMLLLPFYPVIDDVPLKGLPSVCEGKKLILSGGRYWKAIDAEDTYFRLVKGITDQNPDTVVLFPGSGDDAVIKQKIAQYHLEDKLILLGWRDDMSALFRKSQAFLNTYPHGGGTMNQYAAHLHVPILSYRQEGPCPNPVECFVCQDGYTELSSVGMENFFAEATKILQDSAYAHEKAERTYNCVMGIEKFNAYFKQMSEKPVNLITFNVDNNVTLDPKQRDKKIDYNAVTGEYETRMVALIGLNSITFNYDFLSVFIKGIIPKITKVIKSRGLHFNRI